MKKMTLIAIGSLILVLCFSNFASAIISINGTWSGSAQKVTNSATLAQCSTVSVTVQLIQCKFNNVLSRLVRGTAKVGSTTLKIVGRINDDKTVLLEGTEINTEPSLAAKMVIMHGDYVAPSNGAKAKIIVNQMAFVGASLDIESGALNVNSNEMYDIFTITKQ
ncbi:MAG: hypothetical protein MUE70_17235 [Desulfobacterales bacterium]|jgi:hypothetical protein|nr:hypothetical protein [Desulfobacterales bacterium]